jgi:hypothetical protein
MQVISLFGYLVYTVDHRIGNKLEHIWGFVNDYPFYYLCGMFFAAVLYSVSSVRFHSFTVQTLFLIGCTV